MRGVRKVVEMYDPKSLVRRWVNVGSTEEHVWAIVMAFYGCEGFR